MNPLLAGLIIVSTFSFAIPILVEKYNERQSRIPKPLAAQTDSSNYSPAADSITPTEPAKTLPPEVLAQLDADRQRVTGEAPSNKKRLKKLNENRTEYTHTYLNADGTKTFERTLHASNFKDLSGNWADVDSTLEKDASDGKWKSKANSWKVSFGVSDQTGIEIAERGQTLTFKPVDGASVEPEVTGEYPHQVVTYRNVWQGIDIKYHVTGSEVQESIVVKSRVARTDYQFSYSGANISADSRGKGWFKLDGALSNFQIAAPTVATAKEGVISGTPLVDQTVAQGIVSLALDKTWLEERSFEEFPVVVDPTVTRYSGPNNWYRNFNTNGTICDPGQGCGNSAGNTTGNVWWRFAYHVDLTGLVGVQNMYIVNATLNLGMPNPGVIGYPGTYDPRYFYHTHAGCTNSFNCADYSYGTSSALIGQTGSINATEQWRKAVDLGESGAWMMVAGEQITNYHSYKFFSHDLTRVTFDYDQLPNASTRTTSSPADGGTTITTQPSFYSTAATDPDNIPGTGVKYRYTVGTSKSGAGGGRANSVGGIIADSGYLTTPMWTAPDNLLKDGGTYYWQVQTNDSYPGAASTFSPVYSFKVDLRTGKDSTQAYDTIGPLSTDLATGTLTTSANSHSIASLGGNVGISLDYNSPQKSRAGLVAEYFRNDSQLTTLLPDGGTPAISRVEPNIDYSWGTNTAYVGKLGNDWWRARWTGYFVAPTTGTYNFGGSNDDRMSVVVNGQSVYDNTGCATACFGTGIALTAGQVVPIKVLHNEYTGSASARLYVSGAVTQQIVPTAWLQTGSRPTAATRGLIGNYYTGDTLPSATSPDQPERFLSRTDPSPSFDWSTGSPVPNGPADNFVARWTGSFRAPQSGTYKFDATGDEGIKIIVNGVEQLNTWTTGPRTATTWSTAGVTFTAGETKSIEVQYKETTGAAKLTLYADGPGIDPGAQLPSDWLLPSAQVLPDGWNLGVDADGDLGYDFAYITAGNVILRDSTGETHEYKWTGSGFTPPLLEDGKLTRNGDGSVTLEDGDGRTYIFNLDGTLRTSTTPLDDRKPAALRYIYGDSPARLKQISDMVSATNVNDPTTASRWAKILYWGGQADPCPTSPDYPTNVSELTGLICQVKTSDNETTNFYYNSEKRLARIEHPGAERTDYGYLTTNIAVNPNSCPGCLASVRESIAYDAVTAGARADDDTILTKVAYDALGRVDRITQPKANAADTTRQSRSYEYLLSDSRVHVSTCTTSTCTNVTEPFGFTRKITYDATFRTLTDTDVANQQTSTEWDVDTSGTPRKDLVHSTTDPAGLKSTVLYDYADRPTDEYGPAPSAWFGTDRKPLTSPTDYTTQVPRTSTSYDQGISGLAASYYNATSASNGTGVSTKLLSGTPKAHSTGIGATNAGEVNRNWASAPYTFDGPGWGTRLTGDILLPAVGTYTFSLEHDDGVRLWIDEQLIIDDWADGISRTSGQTAGVTVTTTAANTYRPIRIDYYNKLSSETDAKLILRQTVPGNATPAVVPGANLLPKYGLTTSEQTFDSSAAVGNVATTTNYGANPELALAQSKTLDPAGLNYTYSRTYEAQGATGSFLRQLSKTLPGGTASTYAYYAATDTADNPCTAGTTEAFKQAGMLKLKTETDPDGAGTLVGRGTETIYDDAGRIVATRIIGHNNVADPWTCTSYDSRGRVTTVAIPSINAQPARTVTNNWAVGGNPLVVSIADSIGTITTTSDLLGRTVSYTDALGAVTTTTYDSLGRLASRISALGTEAYTYDNYNRLTGQLLDSVTLATPSYDTYGRLAGVTYPNAGAQALTISRDALGRTSGMSYTLGNGTTGPSDSVTRSQSGQIISGTELGATKSYAYDKAGRLTQATIGTNTWSYNFGTPTTCTATNHNQNAGKNSNRTSTTQTVAGVTTTKTFCYDYADRIVSSNDATINNITYDNHGNTTRLGNTPATQLYYDSSDRNREIRQNFGTDYTISFNRDVQDRIVYRAQSGLRTNATNYYYTGTDDTPDYARSGGVLSEKYFQLPGGVLLTVRPPQTGNAQKTYSLVNIHGDTMATTDASGTQTGTFQYDPFGQVIGTTSPNNTTPGATMGWVGQHEKLTDSDLVLDLTQMGARVYIPSLGRFASVDPVEGGVENNYVYPPDPINEQDITGEAAFLIPFIAAMVARAAATHAAKQAAKKAALELAKRSAREAARKTALKNIAGLQKQVAMHKQKLADYKKDPWKHDNQGQLRAARNNKALQQKIIQARIRSLESQIRNFETQISNWRRKL
jgi:RHS repeat-associated protein